MKALGLAVVAGVTAAGVVLAGFMVIVRLLDRAEAQ